MEIVSYGLYKVKDEFFTRFKSEYFTDNKSESPENTFEVENDT